MKYKYVITVGNHPHYEKIVRSNSLEKSEKTQNKLAREYRNEQVDLFEVIDGNWEHLSLVSIV